MTKTLVQRVCEWEMGIGGRKGLDLGVEEN